VNLNTPKNQRFESGLEGQLSKYFRKLEQAFPYIKVSRLYTKYVKESLSSDTDSLINPVMATLNAELAVDMEGSATAAYLSASADMISWGKTSLGLPQDFEGPPIRQAIDYAKERSRWVIKNMDEETRRRLGQTISDGIKNKRGIPGLTDDIKEQFRGMSEYRADMIARTETNDALSQAMMDRSKDMGVDGKQWFTFEPCEICIACAAVGIVPLDYEFPHDGLDPKRPPAHPRCNCSLAPARLKK